MSTDAGQRCWHCEEPLPANAPVATVAGVAHSVCCHGCRAAAEWIGQLGLDDYYRLRTAPATRFDELPSGSDSETPWSRPEMARHVVRALDADRSETILLVDGIRCAACVWLIERSLRSVPGIADVQVNASARRARVIWNPRESELPDIISAFERIGYRALPLDATALDDVRRHASRAALKRLMVAGFGAMQAMMYASAIYLGAFDEIDATTRDLLRWFGLLVATPVVFYSAQPFFAGAVRSLRARTLGMDVPIALAVALVYAASVFASLRGGAEVYFDSVSMFVFFLLIGRYLEMRARHRAADQSDALARLTPAFADRYRENGSLERVGAIELVAGDRVHVAEGAHVPADGTLISDICRIDESLLSGESVPVAKHRGDLLVAGSTLVSGPAQLRVERVGADTALAGIVALVARAQTERPRLAQASDRLAGWFVDGVLLLAALTATIWSVVDPTRAFTATIAVLVVSCPCAFALAVPAALTRAVAVLARRSILIVHTDAIESLARASHVVFDKTGTLTEPSSSFDRIEMLNGSDDRDGALALAAALARGSRHPVAMAIAAAAGDRPLADVEDLTATAGRGLRGRIDGRELFLGQARFALADESRVSELDNATILADSHGPIAALYLSERLRADARDALAALSADGLEIEIASGDAKSRVAPIAARLGVVQWHARMSPADKLARLNAMRSQGARVIAVGDGINDAPVLAGADVAVALAGGTELAQASSDIVLANERLDALVEARHIARQTLTILSQNMRWAIGYNLVAVPFAAVGLVPPWLAAIGMSVSSLVVILNALRIGHPLRVRHDVAAPANVEAPA